MLRFNPINIEAKIPRIANFNTSYVTVQQLKVTAVYLSSVFQYILCYGSTALHKVQNAGQQNFNTSYVTVQLSTSESPLKSKDISIHPMLRFNHVDDFHRPVFHNFNTSYVTVQL